MTQKGLICHKTKQPTNPPFESSCRVNMMEKRQHCKSHSVAIEVATTQIYCAVLVPVYITSVSSVTSIPASKNTFMNLCDNTLPADPHYLNHLNYSWPLDRLVVFLISGQGISHFFTDTQPTTYTTERAEEKKNKHGLGLAPSAKREKFLTLLCSSLCVCRLSQACIWAKFPQGHKGRLTHLPTLANLASQSTGSSSHLSQPSASPNFCRLVCSVHFSWLTPSFLSMTFLPLSSSSLMGNLMHKSFVWVSSQNRQRDALTAIHTHTNEWMPSIMSHNALSLSLVYIYIYISLRKTKTGHIRIINLFPSCYGYWYESITPKITGLLQS